MGLADIFKKFQKNQTDVAPSDLAILRNWYKKRYESTAIQRNIIVVILAASILTTAFSAFVIRYVKSTKSIEPFVIEIERKTGVPTVVDPVSIEAYSSNQAISRYFVWKYITAREEYFSSTYQYHYNTVVRVLSSPEVYFSDYRPKYSMSNPNSPYNIYGTMTNRVVNLKSMIFTNEQSVQVRISIESTGVINLRSDKIIFMEFSFNNIEMNDAERMINPLGFRVKLYRIEDEQR